MYYTKWKTQDSKGYLTYYSIYLTLWKRQSYMDGKQISWCQGFGWERVYLQRSSMREIFGIVELRGNQSAMVLTWQYTLVTTHRTIPPKGRILWYINSKNQVSQPDQNGQWLPKWSVYWQLSSRPMWMRLTKHNGMKWPIINLNCNVPWLPLGYSNF